MWGAQHGVRWGNLRFYYNPYVGRLQPVGYDDNFHERQPVARRITDKFFAGLLEDESIRMAYMDSLRSLVDDVLSGNLVRQLKDLETGYAAPLYSEFFLLEPYDFSDLILRAKWIKENILLSSATDIDYASVRNAHIYIVQKVSDSGVKGGYELQLNSAIPKDLLVTDLRHPDLLMEKALRKWFSAFAPIRLPARSLGQMKNYSIGVPEEISKGVGGATFIISAVDGTHSAFQNVESYFESMNNPVIRFESHLSNLFDRGVLSIDKKTNALVFNTGNWSIDETIKIQGYSSVVFSPGVTLVFSKGAGLLSTIPIKINGKKSKVSFIGDGKSGWLYLMGVKSQSDIEGLVMRNINAVNFDQITLTGALSIYASKIKIDDLVIDGVKSEDAVNIINSDFLLTNCAISNTASDGIDTDFANGEISLCRFSDIGAVGGGDAVDFSGSEVKVSDSFFKLISDKAISAGEGSTVYVDKVTIENSSVGVASKDGSSTQVVDSKIVGSSHAALMTYVKKNEYSGATLEAVGTKIRESGENISDLKSTLLVDGVQVQQTRLDTDDLYKTIMKPGLK